MKHLRNFLTVLLLWAMAMGVYAQNKGGVRGAVLEKKTGTPVPYATVYLNDGEFSVLTEVDGFFTISNVPEGEHILRIQYLGFDSLAIPISIPKGKMITQNLLLEESSEDIDVVNVSAERDAEKNEVRVSVISVTPKEINRIPAAGGEPDFAQYLQVIPGVVFTGDQGGQLYIRGGAPIQNRIILDGMTIYNAFHSIGFFSVFETDVIRSADVYTGGFSAKYGGRSSAIIDVKTREGNKTRFSGLISVNPFVAKGIFEGPILKFKEKDGSSLTFLMTLKHSYLKQTSRIFYPYANERGYLPYNFTDGFAKLTYNGGNGSRVNVFGFSFNDFANFDSTLRYNWISGGAGIDFRIVPKGAKILMDGTIAYSNYKSTFVEGDSAKQRYSSINNFSADMNFIFSLSTTQEINYGLEVNSFFTDFVFTNNRNVPYDQKQSNTEVALYLRHKGIFGPIVLEPSFRLHYYASLGEVRAEPRLGLKWNITEFLRFKMAGGMYSQNLISSVDERDVVNLFVGFLGAPDEGVFRITGKDDDGNITYEKTKSNLQTSYHAIAGFEANITKFATLNVEPYLKYFPQIVGLNRHRTDNTSAKYIAESGWAYGMDFSAKFEKEIGSNSSLYVYLAYALGFVTRNDGLQEYFASFDRRHNMNIIVSYEFGKGKKKTDDGSEGTMREESPELEKKKDKTQRPFEVSVRWNLASGFPFTLTQGFYQSQTFFNGITSDFLSSNNEPNTNMGVIYDDEINKGRLPYYHRLDISFKYTLDLIKYMKLQFTVGVTNAYNRENIFYFDRIRYDRINQLPIMPTLGLNLRF